MGKNRRYGGKFDRTGPFKGGPYPEYPKSKLVSGKLPCPDCGSSDGLHLYDDGHSFCFVCLTWKGDTTKRKDLTTPEEAVTIDKVILEMSKLYKL